MNKALKKVIVLLICFTMLATIFAGCSGDSGVETDSDSPEQDDKQDTQSDSTDTGDTEDDVISDSTEKVTLSFLIDKDTVLDGMEAVMEAIEEKYNIATEIEIRPGGAEGENVVKTRLATGEMTDLNFFNSGSLFGTLNPEANFVDLTNELYMSNIDESFLTTVTFDDKVYAIPAGTAVVGAWLYNKKIYEELGLSVPKTWEELLANCEKIKEAEKVAVIASYKDDWTSQLILLADFYNVQAQAPTFAEDFTYNRAKFSDTPAALRGFEKIREIYDKGYMNEDFLATTYDAALKMLVDGTGAHYPMLSSAVSAIAANYPDKVNDIGVFGQPSDSADINGITAWMPAGISINNKSEHIDAAKKWAEFYVSEEGINVYMSKQKPEGPFLVKGIELPDDVYEAVKDMLAYFETGKTAPALEFVSPVKGPNSPQICIQTGSGIKTPSENAQEYDKDVEKQAKQLGLEGW